MVRLVISIAGVSPTSAILRFVCLGAISENSARIVELDYVNSIVGAVPLRGVRSADYKFAVVTVSSRDGGYGSLYIVSDGSGIGLG